MNSPLPLRVAAGRPDHSESSTHSPAGDWCRDRPQSNTIFENIWCVRVLQARRDNLRSRISRENCLSADCVHCVHRIAWNGAHLPRCNVVLYALFGALVRKWFRDDTFSGDRGKKDGRFHNPLNKITLLGVKVEPLHVYACRLYTQNAPTPMCRPCICACLPRVFYKGIINISKQSQCIPYAQAMHLCSARATKLMWVEILSTEK